MPSLPDDFSAALAEVPASAFSTWVTGDRGSDEREQLSALAETLGRDELRRLHAALGKGAPTWRELGAEGVDKDRFLGLMVALMSRADSDSAGVAAAAYMASLRCAGAVSAGILNPMAAFELSKALRLVLCASAPAKGDKAASKAAPGRKRTKPDANGDWDADRPEGLGLTRDLVTSELCLLLKSVPLRSHPDVFGSLVAALVTVATSVLATAKPKGGKAAASAEPAPSRYFEALALCLRTEHGGAAQTVPVVFRALVPHLALDAAPATPTVPKELLAAQSACVDFVLRVVAAPADADADADAPPADAEVDRSLLHSVQALLQRVSLAAPERAEARAQVCAALGRLVGGLPPSVATRFARFLWRYGHTAKIGARTFATEVSGVILQLGTGSARAQATLLGAEDAPQTLWRLVVQRLSDKAAGVRAKALSVLAPLLEGLHAAQAARLLTMVQQPLLLAALSPGANGTPLLAGGAADRRLSLLSAAGTPLPRLATPGSAALLPREPSTPADGGASSPSASLVHAAKLEASLASLGALLQQRCADERPAVRRAALVALEAWAVSSGAGLSRTQMAVVCERCQDSSPMIRKQAARSLTALLELDPSSAVARQAWTDGVLPLTRDGETSVADAAVEAVEDRILLPLAECHKEPRAARDRPLWLLLTALRPPSLPHLQHAAGVLAARGHVPPKLAPTVQALLAPEELRAPQPAALTAQGGDVRAGRAALWALLLQLSQTKPKPGSKEQVDAAQLLGCWRAASKLGATCADDAAGALRVVLCLAQRGGLAAAAATQLRAELLAQMEAMQGTPETVALIAQTCCALGEIGATDGWSHSLRATCASTICAAASTHSAAGSLASGTRAVQLALVVYGELTLALSLAAPGAAPAAPAPAVVAAATEFAHGECEAALSATAFVALGKFCMGSAELSKKLLPMFMRELSSNEQPAVRNNALVVLFDLVKQHAALFDRHLPTIGLAAADRSPLVRHHAVMLLAQLLLEDYIKWRPALFRAFCLALVDAEPTQRALASSCLFDMLLPRAPLLAFNSFVPLLIQLNGCLEHPQHPAPLPPEEKAAFELSGDARQGDRLAILRALLASMSDEQRLQITAKLCHEVLAGVLDGQMELAAAQAVLGDSLRLLACKEAKILSGDGSVDEAEDAGAAAAAAKGKVLSIVARKATVEAIVPIVVELKRHLEKHRSPLLRDVFLFLRELLRDHKHHLADILSRDKQLAAEIEYDMRQLTSDAAAARALASATRATPGSAAPPPRRSSLGSSAMTPKRPAGPKGGSSSSKVPTPDRLRGAMSIPKLRAQRPSLSGSGMGMPPPTSRLGGAGAANRMVEPPAGRSKSADDVVMASPFKEPPPPRQWNVVASPLEQGLFDAAA